jgi:hypothetical protein
MYQLYDAPSVLLRYTAVWQFRQRWEAVATQFTPVAPSAYRSHAQLCGFEVAPRYGRLRRVGALVSRLI